LINNLSKHVLSPVVYHDFITSIGVDINDEFLSKVENLQTTSEERRELHEERYIPMQEDTLFWCAFIHKFGKSEYDLIRTKYKNHEIAEKKKIVDCLIKHKNVLKLKKICKSDTQEIMGKLMINRNTDLQSFHGICAFYNLRIFVVNNNKRTYIDYDYSVECDDDNESNILVIYKSGSLLSESKSTYSMKLSNSKSEILNIMSNFIKFKSYDKPFNGLSSYKLADLIKIRKILGLAEGNKKRKSEVFSEINIAVA
jgi:hypothetical protein